MCVDWLTFVLVFSSQRVLRTCYGCHKLERTNLIPTQWLLSLLQEAEEKQSVLESLAAPTGLGQWLIYVTSALKGMRRIKEIATLWVINVTVELKWKKEAQMKGKMPGFILLLCYLVGEEFNASYDRQFLLFAVAGAKERI